MSSRDKKAKSVSQRVANRGHELRLSREDAFTAYAMDRLLYRLGRSRYAKKLCLKGGVLVANFLDAPHRFTRDVDLLCKRAPAEPDVLRQMFRQIVAVDVDDGIVFEPDGVRAQSARREFDGYDGVTVWIRAQVGQSEVDLKVDVGFGDAVVPDARRIVLKPFLLEVPPPQVYAYSMGPVLAEKIETLLSKFPAIEHRLKDILDVVTLSDIPLVREDLLLSMRATFERRGTRPDVEVLDDMRKELKGRKWEASWAAMCKEKAVADDMTLQGAVDGFDRFVRPLLLALSEA